MGGPLRRRVQRGVAALVGPPLVEHDALVLGQAAVGVHLVDRPEARGMHVAPRRGKARGEQEAPKADILPNLLVDPVKDLPRRLEGKGVDPLSLLDAPGGHALGFGVALVRPQAPADAAIEVGVAEFIEVSDPAALPGCPERHSGRLDSSRLAKRCACKFRGATPHRSSALAGAGDVVQVGAGNGRGSSSGPVLAGDGPPWPAQARRLTAGARWLQSAPWRRRAPGFPRAPAAR